MAPERPICFVPVIGLRYSLILCSHGMPDGNQLWNGNCSPVIPAFAGMTGEQLPGTLSWGCGHVDRSHKHLIVYRHSGLIKHGQTIPCSRIIQSNKYLISPWPEVVR